jgi:hypothetical protein
MLQNIEILNKSKIGIDNMVFMNYNIAGNKEKLWQK